MDLRRAKNPEKLLVCKRYYIAGFFMLPFLWVINCIWFFKEAFRKPQYTEQALIRTYVIRSFIGAIIYLAILITWVIVFQLNRVKWGSTGDALLFTIPYGSA